MSKRVLITGGTGFLGSQLSTFFKRQGCGVDTLSRRACQDTPEYWQPDNGFINPQATNNIDTVIHLAGESLFNKRWSKKQKAYILNNRRQACRTLVNHLFKQKTPPKNLFIASAIGFYGDTHEQRIDEQSPQGKDFAAEICQVIEDELQPLNDLSIRVVVMRFGIILHPSGGALKRMLLPFKFGLGGSMGNGYQWMSWISLTDCLRAIDFLISHPNLSGIFNLTSASPVTNQHFSRALAKHLRRPCLLPLPATAIHLLFGEMGDTLLLNSSKVYPARLLDEGFVFQASTLEDALNQEVP